MSTESVPSLTGVPETMLWTLHNRASEALHPRGALRDDKCVAIYRSIDYDYERSFGRPEPSHGVRSAAFDAAVRAFVAAHPDAVVVNLGEGLETQRFRVADGPGALWLSVDVPEAIAARERFIAPDERHLHVALSALDRRWFDAVPPGRPVFVTAQGLFMYFTEGEVRGLIRDMARRWPGAELMFDHVPRWLSRKSLSAKGWYKTPHYRVPPLPWGLNRSEVLPTLRAWVPGVEAIALVDYRFPRGWRRALYGLLGAVPWTREHGPGIAHVRLGARP